MNFLFDPTNVIIIIGVITAISGVIAVLMLYDEHQKSKE